MLVTGKSPTALTHSRYGWRKDRPDPRDHKFSAKRSILTALPPSVDLRPFCPPIVDQGQLGSCTANAIAGADQFDQMKQRLATIFPPSRLFIYYGEREIEATIDSDAGAEIRDGIKVLASLGAPPETDWPYDVSQFATKPPPTAYADALLHRAIQYQAVNQDEQSIKAALASSLPVMFGFTVYQSFESQTVAATGIVPMPRRLWDAPIGGHAVCAVGYDDQAQHFVIRNSWGTGWGMDGYCYMPYGYLTNPNLASDFWVIETMEGAGVPNNVLPPWPANAVLTFHQPPQATDRCSVTW